jgi:hypothetical protein
MRGMSSARPGPCNVLTRRSLRALLSLSMGLALAAAPSCGGSSGGDQTTKFSGAWTFKSGSLTPTCPIPGLSPFDLTGLNVAFTKVDDSTIALMINTACNLHFHAADTKATVLANQTCALDLGGALGMQNIMITSWTLSLAGDEIDCTLSGRASLCTAAGTGVLVRGTTDAGDGGAAESGAGEGDTDGGIADGSIADGGADTD